MHLLTITGELQGKVRSGGQPSYFWFSALVFARMALPIRSSVLRLGDSSHEDRSKRSTRPGKREREGKGKGKGKGKCSGPSFAEEKLARG